MPVPLNVLAFALWTSTKKPRGKVQSLLFSSEMQQDAGAGHQTEKYTCPTQDILRSLKYPKYCS